MEVLTENLRLIIIERILYQFRDLFNRWIYNYSKSMPPYRNYLIRGSNYSKFFYCLILEINPSKIK